MGQTSGEEVPPYSARKDEAAEAQLSLSRGNLKYPPFWGSPLSAKHPQDNFSLRMQIDTFQKGIGDLQSQFLYRITQKSPLPIFHFGGCQFAFWRLKLSWECSIAKGGATKRGCTLGSPHYFSRFSQEGGESASTLESLSGWRSCTLPGPLWLTSKAKIQATPFRPKELVETSHMGV